MALFLTSDQHFGHRRICEYSSRPFRDVDHMREELIARHNAVVGPDDTVVHLGDFCLDDRIVKQTLYELNGIHHLIAGNHDACHPCHRRHVKFAQRYIDWGFRSVASEAWFDVPELGRVHLHHMPYSGDHTEKERYTEFRPKPTDEVILLHGHVHELWRVRDDVPGRPTMVNVGVDVWDFTPVTPAQIAAYLSEANAKATEA